MRVARFVFSVLLFVGLFEIALAEPEERIWVSFGGDSRKYLMSIDSFGNVIIPPFRVSELDKFRYGRITALSLKGSRKLNLWYVSNVRSERGQIHRLVIDKKTLQTQKWVKTNLTGGFTGDAAILDVTNRKDKNFISFPTSTDNGMRLVAYPLNDVGQVVGPGSFLSPALPLESCGTNTRRCKAGTSPDGRIVYWIQGHPTRLRTDLFVQPIGPMGKPILEPVFIDKVTHVGRYHSLSRIDSVAVTNVLAENKRFLVYTKQPPDNRPGTLLLQCLAADTGNKIGEPITLLRADVFAPNLRIDPKGRFVLFDVGDDSLGAGLAYLALDATGNPSGNPKILSNLVVAGIAVLPEKL